MKYNSISSGKEYRLTEDSLDCLIDDAGWQRVGGKIEVIARTRDTSLTCDYGALIQWHNIDGQLIKKVISNQILQGDKAHQVRDLLLDTGYLLEAEKSSWNLLRYYLIKEMPNAPTAISVGTTGWHDGVFVAENWTLGEANEPYYFIGESRTMNLKRSGDFESWKGNVASLSIGNPMMVFTLGIALAAPLLKQTETENGIFHFVGPSSTGKTTLLQLGASVYSDKSYMMGWIATDNGLAAAAAGRNDLLFLLDEIGANVSKDLGAVIYHLMSGVSKQRASKDGSLASGARWRTLGLSTGEISLSEALLLLDKEAKAGQEVRLIEVPVFGQYGAFNNIHGFVDPQSFVDHLKKQIKQFHGSLLIEWIHLIINTDNFIEEIETEKKRISNLWSTLKMSSQVVRSLQRFALIAAVLSKASQENLLPWGKEDSVSSVRECWGQWLQGRGHVMNLEDWELLKNLKKMLPEWKEKLLPLTQYDSSISSCCFINKDEPELWFIDPEEFKAGLNLPHRSKSQIFCLVKLGLLKVNERARGTYRYSGHRFFALYPAKVNEMLEEFGDE